MSEWAVAIAVALALLPSVAAGQNCKKGIPCGHSCISASKVCRVGAPPPAAAAAPAPAAGARGLVGAPASPPTGPTEESFPFIGSFADGVYFLASCVAAQDLAPDNRRYFGSEAVAQGAGFRRSRTPGC